MPVNSLDKLKVAAPGRPNKDSRTGVPGSPPAPRDERDVIGLYEAGFSVHSIAPTVGMPHIQVDKILRTEFLRRGEAERQLRDYERRQSQRTPQLIRPAVERAEAA